MSRRATPYAPLILILAATGCIIPFNGPGGVRREAMRYALEPADRPDLIERSIEEYRAEGAARPVSALVDSGRGAPGD